MAKRDGFDEIGLSYCKNFDEVEAARKKFEEQRQAILNRLDELAGHSLQNAGWKFDKPHPDGEWRSRIVDCKWTKLRRKRGKESSSEAGLYFCIAHDPSFKDDGGGRFGFLAGVFFSMSQDRYTELKPSLAGAPGAHSCAIDYWSGRGGPSACVRSAWILPGSKSFKLASFEAEIRRLPGLFKNIDGALTAAYARGES